MADLTNAADRRRLRRAGRPLRARRRGRPPRHRLPQRGQGRARGVRVGRGARPARAGSPSCRASARRSRRRSSALRRDRRHPGGREAAREVPGRADRRSRACRASAPSARAGSTTSSASTRSTRCARRPRRQQLRERARASAPKVEENVLAALAEPGDGERPAPRVAAARRRSPIAEQIVEALRAHPAADRVELAGSRAAPGRHRQGPRHHRHRRPTRRRWLRALAELDARRVGRRPGENAGARVTHAHRA